MIDKWFGDWDIELCGAKHRLSTLICLFNFLNKNGVSKSGVNEEMVTTILKYVSPPMPTQATNIILLEIHHAMEIAMDEVIVEKKMLMTKEQVAKLPSPDESEAFTYDDGTAKIVSDDEYDEEDAKPKLHIDKSELKTKEFDMEVLKELGLNIEDLQNE